MQTNSSYMDIEDAITAIAERDVVSGEALAYSSEGVDPVEIDNATGELEFDLAQVESMDHFIFRAYAGVESKPYVSLEIKVPLSAIESNPNQEHDQIPGHE